ncbi:hypothetical protein DVH24_020376 [Malus domestica]|uniref:Lariat debranching enzyme C-terminal domain-containing protein n=1 Tax=Malus domestica TaxID=3750 RepID=A0A498JC24_MALDO|nr:hypothetical protein DVH24_020376 [Malus domestica]
MGAFFFKYLTPKPTIPQYDEEWLEITRRFNSIFPLTTRSANLGCVHFSKYVFLQTIYGSLLQLLPNLFLFQASLKLTAKLSVGSVEENSEDIPIDDVDELEEDAVDSENENS